MTIESCRGVVGSRIEYKQFEGGKVKMLKTGFFGEISTPKPPLQDAVRENSEFRFFQNS